MDAAQSQSNFSDQYTVDQIIVDLGYDTYPSSTGCEAIHNSMGGNIAPSENQQSGDINNNFINTEDSR